MRLQTLVRGVRVDFDELLGSPKSVSSTERLLTDADGQGGAVPATRLREFAADDPFRVVKGFVAEHAAMFGFGPGALADARVTRDDETARNGMHTIVWQQETDGIRVFESTFQANVTRRGELVNISSRFVPDARKAAEAGTPNQAALRASPVIDARQAVSAAAETLGEKVAPAQLVENGQPSGPSRKQQFRSAALLDVGTEFVWLPEDESALRLCWEVIFMSKARGEMFRTLVDAETGVALVRQRLTEYLTPASYRVFTGDSPTPMSPGLATPGTAQPGLATRTLVTLSAFDTTASPNGWIDVGGNETRGNNVDAHLDLNADNVADVPRPQGSPSRVFDFALDLTQAPSAYRDAAVTELFYWNNYVHDRYYQLGFTETAGNFQVDNFTRGGLGNDAVQADAQDGSGTNNANFSSPPDGSAGRMQMYVFTGPTPDRDGDFDQEVVIHEYTHGLSNRLVGGGVGISAVQPRGMGEGWSDFYALCLLSDPGDDPNGVYASGGYASYQLSGLTQNYYFGIRRYPYCTDLAKNPLTFKDIDPAQISAHTGVPKSPLGGGTADEVHNQGEVWCVTLWEVRAKLIAKHGAAAGNNLVLELVTDGMKLAPANPTFLQARDAIIQADLVDNSGANRGELWAAFAKRGMGSAATSPASSGTNGVVENFDIPDNLSISPPGLFTATGAVSGPFAPSSRAYTLVNSGTAPLNWTVAKTQAWLTLAPTGGTLAPGGSATVTATINSAANNLTVGTYSDSFTFTNTTSGLAQARGVQLGVEPFTVPIFAETWESGTAGAAWAITGTSTHRTLVTTANGPHGGAYHLTMDSSSDASYARNEATLTVNLAGRHNVLLRFWVKMFNDEADGPPASPFPMGADFDGVAISADGTNWYEVQPLRTYVDVWTKYTVDLDGALAARGLSYNASFKIRFNHYDNYTIPTDGFAFDDIDLVEVVNNRLTLAVPLAVSEGAGSVNGTLNVTPAPANALTVALASSDPTEATVPATVTVPAGQASVVFPITLPDDALLDGTQAVTLTATAAAFTTGTASFGVEDNETATLTLSVPATAVEGVSDLQGTVSMSAPAGSAVTVALASSDVAEVQVPGSVVIPPGQTSAVFPITVVDDSRIDGTTTVTVTAHVANWTDGTAAISVADNEVASLAVSLPGALREGDGTRTGTVQLGGTLPAPLVVNLSSNDTTELTVPATVTVPAGAVSANFTAAIVNDTMADGAQPVEITASATGFTNGVATVSVADNDADHFTVAPIPGTQIRNVPFAVTVTAKDVNDATITNFNSSVPLTGTVPVTPASLTSWVNGVWTGNVTATAFGTGVVLTVDDGQGHTGASNSFNVTSGPVSGLAWSAIASPQSVDAPFPVTIRAVDAVGNSVPTFAGPANLTAHPSPPAIETGTGTSTTTFPFYGYYQEARLQTLYPASELGGPATLTALSLNVSTASASVYGNFTVRLKHSPLAAYTTASFDATGWTEVYRGNVTPSPAGWLTLPLSVPFVYDGTSSLLVDLSFDNATYVIAAYVSYTSRNSRAISGYASGTLGDPRTWSGTTGNAGVTSAVPNLRFTVAPQSPLPLSPAATGAFVGGEWTGNISVPFASAALWLRAASGALTADSNVFAVTAATLPSNTATVFAEDFESGALNSAYWLSTGTGNFRTQVTSLYSPHGGTRHLTMDTTASVARNEATLTVNLAGRTGAVLKFWAAGYTDEPSGPPASPFTGGADFDGVAISANGTTWWEVQALRSLPSTYGQFTVDLDAAIAARGLSYGSAFKIRFNQYDDNPLTTDGIGIDDIVITANAPPSSLVVTLPAQTTEGAGVISGSVFVSSPPAADLLLNLSSKSPAKISVPATVTIPAGQTSVTFPLTVLDDLFVDGTKNVVITAAGPGFLETGATVQVVDNDGGTFTLTLPATVTEGAATATGTVALSVPSLVPITVALSSNDATELAVPATVTVAAGQTSATFNATALEDGLVDGTQNVTVTAHLAGWTDGTASLSVLDDGRDTTLDWPTFGNGPAHTGYQPITLGANTYQAGWTKTFATSTSGLNQVAVRDGTVFVTPYTYFGDTYLSALNSSTGTERWRQTFVSSFSINPPTVNAGKVYVQKGNSISPGNDAQLWCLDAAGGGAVWTAPFGAQGERYFAPTVVNDGVWVNGGYYGGLYGFNTGNGGQRFFNSSLGQYSQWTPAYYNGTIYTWVAGVFRAHDPMVGTILWSSTLSAVTAGVPAIDAGKAFVVGNPNLYAIDLATHATTWTANGTFKGSPAVANGTVFALNAGDVKAYNSQTGALVGTYSTGNTAIAGQPIVTNDAVIVTAPTATYIFNLQTFALRQTLTSGGIASLANGVLYLAGTDGILRTFRPSGQNAITVALSASSATEGSPALTGTVSLASALGSDTVIGLSAGGSSRVTLPTSVTVPAGQTSATFQLGIVNDSLLNGSETVNVFGSGSSYLFLAGSAAITIHDNETATIALSVPASAVESAGSVTGTLTLSAAPAVNLAVSLTSSDTTEATVPATVTVLAGQTSVTFPITLVDDTLIDDTQAVTLTAGVTGWANATATLQVTDNESRNLSLSGPYSVSEGQTSFGAVYLSGTLPTALVVTLTSSNPTQYSVPASVTIPAGQTSASFTSTAVDDTATDGTQSATITAAAATFTSASVTASAYDNDVHHFSFSTIASPQKSGVAFSTTITAMDVNNSAITTFAGTVALSAAGDGGAVAITPAASGTFSGGSWTGNVTCAVPGTNVRLTATGTGVTGTSNAFEVQLSPAIALSPASLSLTLGPGQTATRTLTISNTGGGTLTWNLATAASLAEVVSSGAEFAGHAPVAKDKTTAAPPAKPEPSGIHAELRASAAALESAAAPTLQSALNNLNANNGLIRAAIPTRYAFSEGITGTNIGDGGNDMYDGGNYLGTNLGAYLNYSDNLIATSTLLGAGGQYFTRKYDGLWVFAADISGLTYFEITGNLGADSGGSTDSAVLSVVRDGVTYRGLVKRVHSAADPSVNHLVIVADNGSVTHEVATDTNNDYHRLTNLTGVTRIYHVLYAGTSGAYINNTATLNIMTAFLDAVSTPNWISPNPSSGSVAAGTSQDVTLTLSAANLTAGTYQRTLTVTSNDPFQPQAAFPVTLTVTTEPFLNVTPATGLTASGLRGGPFTPASQTFTLSNPGIQPLIWSVTKTAAWLDVWPTGGTLAPGASVTVSATLNATAASLASGSFADTLTFTNTTNGLGNTTRPVALTVSPTGDLVITPGTDFSASGPFGGPFTPASATYTLTNSGDATLAWTANKTAPWFTLSGNGGTLAPGASTTVIATIAAAATDPGSFSDTVTFTNTTNGRGNSARAVGMTITLPAPVLAPEPPVTGGTGNTVSWNAVFGAGEYEVQAAADAAFTSPVSSGWIAGTSKAFTGLGDNQLYHYRVRSRRVSPEQTGAWTQTTQAEFDTDTKAGVVANPAGNVTLASGSGASLARVLNPSFETDAIGSTTATNWTVTNSGSMNLELSNFSPAAPLPTNGTRFATLWSYWTTHTTGEYIQIAQNVDLTGVGTLVFDGRLSNATIVPWGNAIRGSLRIDGVTRWTATALGAYVNQSVDVSMLTGIHAVEFRCEMIATGDYESQWFCVDNIQTLALSGYAASGTLTSAAIAPAPWRTWGALNFTKDTAAPGTALTVDVLNAAGTLLAANVASGADLNAIAAVASQPSIRLRANLSTTNSANTPRLDDWSVAWQATLATLAESAWSPAVSSLQDATAPVITVTTPVATTAPFLPLAGIATDLSGLASLTVNGASALTTDGFLHWSTAPVALSPGWNTFNLTATDTAVPANTVTRTQSIFLATPGGDADHDGLPDTWEADHGLDLFDNTGNSGARGDPDHDGFANLLERAFGLDPHIIDGTGGPRVTMELNPGDGQHYLMVRYRRLLAPGSLTYSVEVSRDFGSWSPAAANYEEVTPAVPTGDGLTETVTVRIKPPIGPDLPGSFARVRVTVP